MNNKAIETHISQTLGSEIITIRPLSGGMIGEVYRVDLSDGRTVVAKTGTSEAKLSIEGYMLKYLAENSQLPVPQVLHSVDTLLLMSWIEGESHLGVSEQQHAADLLADLHTVTMPQFGLERDTLIGPLHQPNPVTDSWINFFRDHRLLYMAHIAYQHGSLPQPVLGRIERLSAKLEQWLLEPDQPSLIHGDIWTTNLLTQNGQITAFIDPAIYYGHAEIELAYTTLFGTLGQTFSSPFFDRYTQRRLIEPGFFEERRYLYNLYPLLVHVRLFGQHYVNSVDDTLRKFGF